MVSCTSLLEMFPTAISLLKYCELVFDKTIDKMLSTRLIQLTASVLVVPAEMRPHIALPMNEKKHIVSMRELLNRFVAVEIKRNRDFRTCNCLCLGYRLKNAHSASEMRSNLNTECYFVNTLHSVWCSADWVQFATIVGEEAMGHLFSLPVFQPIQNGCFLQLSGIPVMELNRQANEALKAHKFGSHRMLLQQYIGNARMGNMNLRIELPRYKIFYCHRYERYPGLPSKHTLNKVGSSC